MRFARERERVRERERERREREREMSFHMCVIREGSVRRRVEERRICLCTVHRMIL